VHRVLDTGEASWDETLPLILERSGYAEETYHTFSYSPLAGPDGLTAGMLCVVIEDSARVLGERQLAALGTLAATLVDANTKAEVFAAIECGLSDQKDIPFALTYLFDEDRTRLKLVARTGIDADHPAACADIHLDAKDCPWPLDEILNAKHAITFENLSEFFDSVPQGCWDIQPNKARLVPIVRKGQDAPAGYFIAALNPYRQLDSTYSGFLDLIAGQIAASITNAEAFEQEKERAESLTELDRAKTAFFSNVSHELRTPLTLILGPIEDALTSQTPPSAAMLDMLHRNALRLLKMVNGLLDFVRIEAGRLHALYEPTDLAELTVNLASVFRSAVERAGLKLNVHCADLPEPVYVDREMWEKVVLNLLSNALKSTFEGEINVRILSTGKGAQLIVEDTGTGIAESELPRLFERFRRVEGARRRNHEGSGIGLALVKELVELHGGTIAVESRPGAGSTFTVTLPFGQQHLVHGRVVSDTVSPAVVQGSAVAYVREAMAWLPGQDRLKGEISRIAAPDAIAEAMQDAAPAEEHKAVVLLVDDNADMRAYLLGLLGGRFDVVTAENGKRALEYAAMRKPDLVLTDIMMPELDGFGLLAALRQNPATAVVPVVMLSARAGEESSIEGLDAGADDYLTKPFSARELLARVEAQLKMARLRKQAGEQEAALTREIYEARRFAWEALEHIPDAFATLDCEFRITYMNPAALHMASATYASHLGKSLWELYPTTIGSQFEANFRRAMEQRITVEFEEYVKDGPIEKWYHFQVYPQPGQGVIVYLRDETSTRMTEQALRRSEQLAAAGRLAASIAHEINNPLEAVTNLLYLVKMDPTLSEATSGLLEVADKELRRLSHITARSLKFYRQRTAPSTSSLEELIESVLFFHEAPIKIRGIELERRHREAPPVFCFAGEIQQVFTNLIANALDAITQEGKLIVATRPAHDRNGRAGVAVTIADNGSGMERATLDKLFHPFVTTKGEAGTGLGLWVSRGILDKHHATIAVRSKRGCGTVFRIFMPLIATISNEAAPAN
jgi:signal transduction histidine kinase